jgi:hypothetical protein
MPFFMSSRSAAPDHLVERAEAELRHELARFLGDEEEVVDHVLGRAREALAQLRVLRRDANGTRVEVALAHHDAAFDDQRRGREAELVAPSSAPITTSRPVFICPSTCTAMRPRRRLSTSVCCVSASPSSHGDPACLIDDSGEAPVPPSWPGDRDVVRLGLRDAGGHRTHADLGDELDRDRRARVRVLEVVDELRQILDRVDVVMRRRRDEAHARHRVAQLRDVLGHLVTGQLAAFAGLGTLRHLDLQLVADARYSAVTPNRAEATCLMLERRLSPP